MRRLSYALAINEAFRQVMVSDPKVVQIGVGVNTPFYVGNTMSGLLEEFGDGRMIDTPVSENCVAGVAVGAALAGLHPILTFPRMDFMHYAMDQLSNHAAILNYTLGGHAAVPLTVRAIINRGGEQGAQHSQATHSFFMHLPGFRVVAPSNAYDAKGMLAASVAFGSPVIYVEDRWLYKEEADVPESLYAAPLEGAAIVRAGSDVTIISSSFTVTEAVKAAEGLQQRGVSAEVVDLRILKPLDEETILASVQHTGRLVAVDGGWRTCGAAAEVCAIVASRGFHSLKAPVARVTLPDLPAPAARELESLYYPGSAAIAEAVMRLMSNRQGD